MRDALAPSLACAAAHAGDLEALQVLAELVSPCLPLGTHPWVGALASSGQDGPSWAHSPCAP